MLIPRPTDNEPEPLPAEELNARRYAYIQWYLNVPSWKCHECNATMFGRMTYCAYCKLKLKKYTPRREE